MQRCTGTPSQTAAIALSSPAAPSTMRNSGRLSPRRTRSSSTLRQASALSPPMLLIASSTFCPSARTPMHDQQRDGGRFAIEPHAHHGAVENEPHDRLVGQRAGVPRVPIALHLAPSPAHRVLADRAAEQRRERPAHPARVGAGEVHARDQRIGRQRATLIGPQRLALPFRRLARGSVQPRAWHLDLDRPEGARQRPRPAAVAVTRNARSSFIAGLLTSPVTRACQHGVKLAADQLFDELTRASANLSLDRIKPVVEKMGCRLINGLHGIGVRSMAGHGVVSGPALQRRMIRG